MYYLHKATSAVGCVKPNASQWEATLRDGRIFRRIFDVIQSDVALHTQVQWMSFYYEMLKAE